MPSKKKKKSSKKKKQGDVIRNDSNKTDDSKVYVYKFQKNLDNLFVSFDTDGIVAGISSGGDSDIGPAWSFRLWDGAIFLSKFLERNQDNYIRRDDNIVIELGSGTALVSLVAARLGAKIVFITDLPHAIPLIEHNVISNFKCYSSNIRDHSSGIKESITNYIPKCPDGHILVTCKTDCEGYQCNVCDEEVDEDCPIYRCHTCNFDLCSCCHFQVEVGDISSLPVWYKVQLQSQRQQRPTSIMTLSSLSLHNTDTNISDNSLTFHITSGAAVGSAGVGGAASVGVGAGASGDASVGVGAATTGVRSEQKIIIRPFDWSKRDDARALILQLNTELLASSTSSLLSLYAKDSSSDHPEDIAYGMKSQNLKDPNLAAKLEDSLLYNKEEEMVTPPPPTRHPSSQLPPAPSQIKSPLGKVAKQTTVVDSSGDDIVSTSSGDGNLSMRLSSSDLRTVYIVAADVTYSEEAVLLFLKALDNLRLEITLARTSASTSTPVMTLQDIEYTVLLLHHKRSMETNSLLWETLKQTGYVITRHSFHCDNESQATFESDSIVLEAVQQADDDYLDGKTDESSCSEFILVSFPLLVAIV